MATCIYCGERCGFFTNRHRECEIDHQEAELKSAALETKVKEQLSAQIASYFNGDLLLDRVVATPEDWDALSAMRTRRFFVEALEDFIVVHYVRASSPPDSIGEGRLKVLMDRYTVTSQDLDHARVFTRYVMLCAIRDLDEGRFPRRATIEGTLPFNFEPGERIAWVFKNVDYLADKIVRTNSRVYGGVSMRVVQGLYVHTGGPLSAPNVQQGLVPQDKGLLCITDRALYFRGEHKAMKIKLKDVVTFSPYNDGFSVCKGTMTARDQVFVTGDNEGWFSYILAETLARTGKGLS